MDKNSKVISIAKDIYDFAIINDTVFEEHHVYIDGNLKYIIGLYQEGDIWSPDEEYGTYVVNIELEHEPGEYSADDLPYYIVDAVLTVRNNYILNDDFRESLFIYIDKSKLKFTL